MRIAPDLPLLNETERSCLERYLDILVQRLGKRLLEVSVYGSVARGESWPRGMPIRSDLDLLVVTSEPIPADVAATLVDATMPLFLESGRQLGPQFKTREEIAAGSPELAEELRRDAIVIYERSARLGQALA